MSPAEVAARLTAILDRIRRLRASLYPPGYDADPWYLVEKDIERLLNDVKHG